VEPHGKWNLMGSGTSWEVKPPSQRRTQARSRYQTIKSAKYLPSLESFSQGGYVAQWISGSGENDFGLERLATTSWDRGGGSTECESRIRVSPHGLFLLLTATWFHSTNKCFANSPCSIIPYCFFHELTKESVKYISRS